MRLGPAAAAHPGPPIFHRLPCYQVPRLPWLSGLRCHHYTNSSFVRESDTQLYVHRTRQAIQCKRCSRSEECQRHTLGKSLPRCATCRFHRPCKHPMDWCTPELSKRCPAGAQSHPQTGRKCFRWQGTSCLCVNQCHPRWSFPHRHAMGQRAAMTGKAN